MMKPKLCGPGHMCDECEHEGEEIPASYQLPDGTYVCDTHLDIYNEERQANLHWMHR